MGVVHRRRQRERDDMSCPDTCGLQPMYCKILFQSFIVAIFLLFSTLASYADIASLEAEIADIDNQISALNSQVSALDAEIDELTAGMEEARDYMIDFGTRNDWLLSEYKQHRRLLRLYQGREIQLDMSYMDFFEAKNTWEESSDPAVRREQVIIMFRFLYGYDREPGQWELNPNTQQDFVDMADLIVRKKAVARIGEALVLLGGLTDELVDAVTGVPQDMKEAVYEAINFTVTTTLRILPEETVNALNDTCIQYAPWLESQQARAESLKSELNAIRDRDEYGGEEGRLEALEKTRDLIALEQEVLDKLKPEMEAYRSRKATVEANFAAVQKEKNEKTGERDGLRKSIRQLTQERIDKQFQIRRLQEQQAIEENGGPVNYVENLSIGLTSDIIALDAVSSALLDLPLYTTLSATADYVTTAAAECSYPIGDGLVDYETYYIKKTFSAPVAKPSWEKSGASGDVTITDNKACGAEAGSVLLQAALSPMFEGDTSVPCEHCTDTFSYEPYGTGEKVSGAVSIKVRKVEDTLFLPSYYYTKENQPGKTDEEIFASMKSAAATYGTGIDLFVDGEVQKTGRAYLFYTVVNDDGVVDMNTLWEVETAPVGDLDSFEIENQMKVLGQGTVTLAPVLLDKDGVQAPVGSVNGLTVTGNEVEPTLSANGSSDLTPAEEALIVINEPARFSISVKGPANMTRYEVNWRYFSREDEDDSDGWAVFDRHDGAAVTDYSGDSNSWVSVNPVTLTDPADYNRDYKVEFEICRKYDGVTVYSGAFENLRSIVKGKRFFLADRSTGEVFPGRNFFFNSSIGWANPFSRQNLELRLDLGGDQNVLVPLTDLMQGLLYGVNSAEELDLGVIEIKENSTTGERYMYTSLSSDGASGRVELGLYRIRDADADSLLSELGVMVERTAITAMTIIDVNHFNISYRETDLGTQYVAKVYSPRSLKDFTARWTFFDGTVEETPFAGAGLIQESLTPMTRGLKLFELVNPAGVVVGRLGFLSGSTTSYTNRVYQEVRKTFRITTEYRWHDESQTHAGQLISLDKHEVYNQFELDFEFPAGFPEVAVKTVGELEDTSLPVVKNVTVSGEGLLFDVIKPSAGFYTTLTVLEAPASGTVAIDGIHAAYTPVTGFNGTDRFVLRVDGTECSASSDAYYYNLEVETDYSGARPVVRFTQVFTPTGGGSGIEVIFMNAEGQAPAVSLVTPPEASDQLTVKNMTDEDEAEVEGGVDISTHSIEVDSRHTFTLGFSMPGGSSGNAVVTLWYYAPYPEFFAYKNQDYSIPPRMILYRFFERYEKGAQLIRDIQASSGSGSLYLNGVLLGGENQIPKGDLRNLVFRPAADYTGTVTLTFYGSEDGETWSYQQSLGGLVLDRDGMTELDEVIWVLQVLSGLSVSPPEGSTAACRSDDGNPGIAEAIYFLQRAAGLR